MSAPPSAPTQQPLSASWREWIQSGDWKGQDGPDFDAIVIGSGYGGSVAALRLAQKNYRVLLLERGSEYLPGEFPNDFSLLPKFFRANIPTRPAPMGRATGLVEVHLGEGMVAVTGNGLGGGSLINAGVVMQPDADVFAQPQWPAAIRHGPGTVLEPFFGRAREQLRVAPWDAQLPQGGKLAKTAALERLGGRLGAPFRGVDTTVDPDRCLRCGDCAAGCNVPDAKGNLPQTYLRAALATGRVQIVTQAEVYRFEPAPQEGGAFAGWQVHAFATDAQQQFTATREVLADTRRSSTARRLAAPLLFVCAGTLGSTQLLQRSQARAADRLSFSPALGTQVSGNGDSLSWLVDEPEKVASLGRGQAGLEAWEQARANQPFKREMVVGPTITGVVDLRKDAQVPLEERLVVEDGAVPRAIAQLYRELLATASTLKALDDWWFRPPPGSAGEDPLTASELRAQHSQVLLVMGHDGSKGRMVWLDGSDRSAPYLPDPQELPTYKAQQKLFDRIGARHVHNPLWRTMPETATGLMTGPKPEPVLSTVHPLGGCVMSDDPECGVVNDRGQAWVRDPGRELLPRSAFEWPGRPDGQRGERNEPRLYRGLYVLDGSIVPTALGCNPLWTISALAERALDAIPARAEQPPRAAFPGAPRAPQVLPSRDVAMDAVLHEVLLASAPRVSGKLADALGNKAVAARFEADFFSDDIQRDMRRGRHPLRVEATLVLGGATPDAPVELEYRSEGGRFEPLPSNAGSSGPGLMLRSALEAAFLVLALAAVVVLAAVGRPLPAVLALVAAAAGLVLLPLGRTLLTWIILRLVRDVPNRAFDEAGWSQKLVYARTLCKQLVHASEKRVMRYRVPMVLHAGPAGAPRHLTLHATKTVMYRASLPQLWQWLRHSVPLRPTFWEQTMNAQVRVVPRGRPAWSRAWLAGTFRMGFDNLLSSGMSAARRHARGAMELGQGGDTTSGMLALTSYPMLFLRFALKTRLLDFRLPSYSGRPLPDHAPAQETQLRLRNGGFAPAELHQVHVSRGRSSGDEGDESRSPLVLPLWRYRARDEAGQVVPTSITEGSWMGMPVARARSVLLLHAFGQNGLTYTLKTIHENLAEHLQRAGFEVWVLELRMSTRSGFADDPSAIDQIAQHDVPGAVRHILQTLQGEHPEIRDPLQISAFSQCIGSASLWMALLSGKLSHAVVPIDGRSEEAPQLSMLSHLMSSQVHPWIVGARGTQAKTWLPSLLQAVWKRGAVPFAVRGPQLGVLLPMLDRVLSTLPAPAREDERIAGQEDAAATCRRIRFIEAPLFRHENIGRATFAAMNLLFGDANLRLFAQARRFVDREQLVDEDGVNRYVTDANLRQHAAFPLQLLHGAENELFDVSGAKKSFEALGRFHAGWQEQFCQRPGDRVGPVLVPDHGHLDVLIGDRAPDVVFPEISGFLARVLDERVHAAAPTATVGWEARPPRLGPFVGWLREEGGLPVLRVSFGVDDAGGAQLPAIVLRWQDAAGAFHTLQPAPAWTMALAGTGRPHDHAVVQRMAWADLRLEGECAGAQAWQVLSLHPAWGGQQQEPLPAPGSDRFDERLDQWLAQSSSAPALVIPSLQDGRGVDYGNALFRLPPRALATLPATSGEAVFGVGCCRHPGLGPDLPRVDQPLKAFLAGQDAPRTAFSMLLGDQIYADATAGMVDPTSPLERFHERHETAFRREGLGQLLAAMPVYMTPDDHEWIDGYPLGSPLVAEPWPDWRRGSRYRARERRAAKVALRALTIFQRLQSPQGERRGRWYEFSHGCVRTFVIDTRVGRLRERPQMVHPGVLADLREWLRAPAARDALNVVASGSVVLPGMRMNADPANPGCIDTWQYAPQQRQALLDLLVEEARGRFLLLSGDYHVSGAALLQRDGQTVGAAVLAPPLYAPMPYANATPEAVFTDEQVGGLRMVVPAGGDIARGSGLGVLDVRREADGFAIAYRRDLWVWETAQRTPWAADLSLRT
ncbi:NAD(P)-binding protein [Ramlibacter sp. G-1-2-2]|uniref:NAD(P)-binding protein n=1 Tax=Ramlibacter agri TaxID=2728837 RepID=A0A848HEP6_9BURK|nr:alkaline phosphatase D family protein [Ramlibacter agri]NML47949.1 NAD(P)-binding protein [Ramlibacter agri]